MVAKVRTVDATDTRRACRKKTRSAIAAPLSSFSGPPRTAVAHCLASDAIVDDEASDALRREVVERGDFAVRLPRLGKGREEDSKEGIGTESKKKAA